METSKIVEKIEDGKTIQTLEKTVSRVQKITIEAAQHNVQLFTKMRDDAQARLDKAQADLDLFGLSPVKDLPVEEVIK